MTPISARSALALDAAASLAVGLLLVAAAGPLASLLALPEMLLRLCGVFFLPWAALLGWLAARPAPSRRAVAWIAGLNAVWALDSVLLLLTDWVAPNALGTSFILAQAAAVGIFAALQATAPLAALA